MRTLSRFVLASVAVLSPLAPAFPDDAKPGDKPAVPPARPVPKGYDIGQTVPDVKGTDTDGKEFSLATARPISADAAHQAVVTASKAKGGSDATKASDDLSTLSGLLSQGKVDEALKLELARAAGRPFGLVPDPKAVAAWKTVGDVEAWIAKGSNAPILFVWWSPGCPYVKKYRDAIEKVAQTSGARFFPVASNHTDAAADVKKDADASSYRILVDADAKIADQFGAKRTPHAFVLDDKNVLRYAGAIDGDPKVEGERRPAFLADAVAAVIAGKTPDPATTDPKG